MCILFYSSSIWFYNYVDTIIHARDHILIMISYLSPIDYSWACWYTWFDRSHMLYYKHTFAYVILVYALKHCMTTWASLFILEIMFRPWCLIWHNDYLEDVLHVGDVVTRYIHSYIMHIVHLLFICIHPCIWFPDMDQDVVTWVVRIVEIIMTQDFCCAVNMILLLIWYEVSAV